MKRIHFATFGKLPWCLRYGSTWRIPYYSLTTDPVNVTCKVCAKTCRVVIEAQKDHKVMEASK